MWVKRIILVVFMLGGFSASSQKVDSRTQIKHQFGIKGGINYSSVNFKPTVSQELQPGILLGLVYNYQAQALAGIQIEFLYAQYGWTEAFRDEAKFYSRSMNYLEMPFLTNVIIGKKKTHLKLNIGPKFAYLLNETEETNLPEEERPYYGVPVTDDFEIGVAVGAAISHLFSFGEIQFDARFNSTLSNLFDPSKDFDLQNSKNQSIAVSIYYWFDAY